MTWLEENQATAKFKVGAKVYTEAARSRILTVISGEADAMPEGYPIKCVLCFWLDDFGRSYREWLPVEILST